MCAERLPGFSFMQKDLRCFCLSPRERQSAAVITDSPERIRNAKERERGLAKIEEQARRVEQVIETLLGGVVRLSGSESTNRKAIFATTYSS